MSSGINMTQVKRQNQSLILKYLNKVGPSSRKDIAEEVGLTQAAVTIICNELLEEGIIHEVGIDNGSAGAGRRKIFIDIDYDSRQIIAINIEADLSTIALSNLKGDIIEKVTVATDNKSTPEDFLRSLCEIAKTFINKHADYIQDKVSIVSVGIVGEVDKNSGTSLHAYGIWEKPVKVKDIIEENMRYQCIVENNVNAITKATMLLGMGRKYKNIHMIKWGPGVGSAVVIDGQLLEGVNGRAAELGHIIIDKNGPKCSCGRSGCLETRVSFNALNKIKSFEKDDFFYTYENSEESERKAFDEAIDIFARSIVNAMTLLAPENVLLSGYLFKNKEIQDKMIKACRKYQASFQQSKIIPNSLMEYEDYIGPVGSYLYEVLG